MSTESGQSAHRFMIGTVACAVLSDGTNTYRNPMPLLFENALKADLHSVLRAHGIDPDSWNEFVSPYSRRQNSGFRWEPID